MFRRSLFFGCFLSIILLLISGFLVILSFQVSLSPPQQGGLGGAPQAVMHPTLANPASSAIPTPPLTPSKQVIFGGRGPGGSCSNPVGGGTIAVIVQQDFHWGTDHLSARFQADTTDLLCNDWWAWFSPDGQDVPARQILQTLHWPLDLIAPPWIDHSIHVGWMAITFPSSPANVCQNNCGVPKENAACFWTPQLGPFAPTLNFCDPVRAVINAVAEAIGQGYKDSAAQIAFLWQTPLSPFQDDKASGLLTMWALSWNIVLLSITAVIAWGALRSMMGSVLSWLSYAQTIELLPRLIFALLAALLSKQLFLLLLQANNALSALFSSNTFGTIVAHPNPGIKLGSLQIVYGLLGFALLIEEAARIALIYVLFAASPILFFLAALPETQRFAQASATATILLVFLQAIQAFIMDVGDRVLTSVLHEQSGSLTILHLLVALAVLYLTLVVFVVLLRSAFGPGGYALAGFPLFSLVVARRTSFGAWSGLATASRAAARPGTPSGATRSRSSFSSRQAANQRGRGFRGQQGGANARGGGGYPPRPGGPGTGRRSGGAAAQTPRPTSGQQRATPPQGQPPPRPRAGGNSPGRTPPQGGARAQRAGTGAPRRSGFQAPPPAGRPNGRAQFSRPPRGAQPPTPPTPPVQ